MPYASGRKRKKADPLVCDGHVGKKKREKSGKRVSGKKVKLGDVQNGEKVNKKTQRERKITYLRFLVTYWTSTFLAFSIRA